MALQQAALVHATDTPQTWACDSPVWCVCVRHMLAAAAAAAATTQMQACGEPPPEIVEEMSSAIAADLPGLTGTAGAGSSGSGGTPRGLGDLDFGALDIGDLGALAEQLPADLGKGCPVQ